VRNVGWVRYGNTWVGKVSSIHARRAKIPKERKKKKQKRREEKRREQYTRR
jgi:hypothetical protein